jgi:hypothetical protein
MDAFVDNAEVTEVSSYEDYEHLKVSYLQFICIANRSQVIIVFVNQFSISQKWIIVLLCIEFIEKKVI